MPKTKISSQLKKKLDEYKLKLVHKEHKTVKLDLDEPHQKYLLGCGTEVDGTTRALRFIPKDALLGWAYKLGKQGKDMNAETQCDQDHQASDQRSD